MNTDTAARAVRDELIASFRARTPTSALHHNPRRTRAGAASPTGEWAPYPLVLQPDPSVLRSSSGPWAEDLDGNVYLDFANADTSRVHGNSFEPVVAALRRTLSVQSGAASQNGLAELLIERVKSVDEVRFAVNEWEAFALARGITQNFTGRSGMLVFRGSRHASPALLGSKSAVIRLADYNDMASVERQLDDGIAAIFVEPFASAAGVIPAHRDFLTDLREAAHRVGALFVVDETYSLRTLPGGEQSLYDVDPDLTIMGKIIGGGQPIGVVGGRVDILQRTRRLRSRSNFGFQAGRDSYGSFSAGLASMVHLTAGAIYRMNTLAARIENGITAIARETDAAFSVSRSGSIMYIHPTSEPHLITLNPADDVRLQTLHLALLEQGIMIGDRGKISLSTAIDADHVGRLVSGFGAALQRLAT